MSRSILFTLVLGLGYHLAMAQTILVADGPGDTYELINSLLAPGYDVVEVPDCNHQDFGRHIEEVFDSELDKNVFLFHIHTSPDNDRCINFDRQRNEIKTYDKSPDSLLGVRYEEVEYKWKFKLDDLFQPSASFTHLHQLKAVGGPEDAMPLITLTARKGSPNRLELRYAPNLSQSTIYQTDLAPFLGKWMEVKERVLYDEVDLGKYEILITDVVSGDTLFYYADDSIRTWKTDASFIRPKWGIYRSLNNSGNLRDEQVRFADFYIKEIGNIVAAPAIVNETEKLLLYPNPVSDNFSIDAKVFEKYKYIEVFNCDGRLVYKKKLERATVSSSEWSEGLYFVQFSTDRLKSKPIKLIVGR